MELECDHLAGGSVLSADGIERMNEIPSWSLHVLFPHALPEPQRALRARARLILTDELEVTERSLELTVTAITDQGSERRGHRYAVVLRPPEVMLTLRAGYRIFIDKTSHEIALEVLRDAGVPADRVALRLGATYRRRPQCTQYAETEWAFIERVLAEDGISYWFDTDADRGVLVLGDDPGSHDGIVPPVTLPFVDASGLLRTRSFSALSVVEELTHDGVMVRDFDVQHPDVYLDGRAGDGERVHFEYPALVYDSAHAEERAKVRLEQLRRLAVHARGASDCTRMQAGRLMKIEGCADEHMNREYLVIGVEHRYERPAPHDADARPYTNRVSLVPVGSAPFRPELPRRAPRVHWIESAVTTGPAAEEVHVDELGRVKLRFFWDPSGITDDRSSAWVRCIQPALAGAMLLPRVGWEAPVMYFDGCPDRPFVAGRLYNATAVVPYVLPAAAATTSFQSATSPGGGSTNEIRMVDDAGREELFVHASKDQSIIVGGSATTTVNADLTHDVGSMLAEVFGSQSHRILGLESVNIGTDYAALVHGGTTRFIGGIELINAGGNRAVGVGGSYTEIIVPLYVLQCNQHNITVRGNSAQLAGSTTFRAGLGATDSVAGDRTEVIGGAYGIQSGGKFSDTVYGAKRIQSGGAADEQADGPVALNARIGKIHAGSATLECGGAFVISGKNITIDAASITAGALQISGGAVHATGGTTRVQASQIKRPSGEKIT